ncbi:hypothetical protein BGW38_005111 [Lunasporangiospora selenospora]|uniref:Uncharacterized protein n=1 Tax=Lunasporangiospora selenospora TaxID=979761 RepID=A0A9P6FP66_9FUNG|nr:hypothetical protein BGW38_005111 [Lunasporangiospora selenospora]
MRSYTAVTRLVLLLASSLAITGAAFVLEEQRSPSLDSQQQNNNDATTKATLQDPPTNSGDSNHSSSVESAANTYEDILGIFEKVTKASNVMDQTDKAPLVQSTEGYCKAFGALCYFACQERIAQQPQQQRQGPIASEKNDEVGLESFLDICKRPKAPSIIQAGASCLCETGHDLTDQINLAVLGGIVAPIRPRATTPSVSDPDMNASEILDNFKFVPGVPLFLSLAHTIQGFCAATKFLDSLTDPKLATSDPSIVKFIFDSIIKLIPGIDAITDIIKTIPGLSKFLGDNAGAPIHTVGSGIIPVESDAPADPETVVDTTESGKFDQNTSSEQLETAKSKRDIHIDIGVDHVRLARLGHVNRRSMNRAGAYDQGKLEL